MKKYLLFALIGMFTLSACNYLDFDESEGTEKDEAYVYFDNISRLAIASYRMLPQDYGELSGALRESATDNAMYIWNSNPIYDIYNDKWSPLNTIDNKWDGYYAVMHDINDFLENYTPANLDRFQWELTYKDDIKKANMYINEVRLLRALYYFELTKRYGDVPLVTKTLTVEEANTISRTPYDDIIKFIVDECDEVGPKLPIKHEDFYKETGRVTRGLALALKARTLLYAASPLHNISNDKLKWEAAATAAMDVINTGWYNLPLITKDPLYSAQGGNDVLNSSQLIYERRNGESNSFEQHNLPVGFEKGQTGNVPSQDLVDCYEFLDGSKFDWTKEEDPEKIYFDAAGKPTRDPRLYINVLVNGSNFMKHTIETFVGGANAYPIIGATTTGYYLHKLMNGSLSLSPTSPIKKNHHFLMYRYAEVLLNYAEAMAEWKDADFVDGTHTLSARQALNQVRNSAGMPDVTVLGDEFKDAVHNERRIELAFEDHRFWDIRRWKQGELVKSIHGIVIRKQGEVLTYQRQLVEERIWKDKMYLYPIPQNESFKNKNLGQNPGWIE